MAMSGNYPHASPPPPPPVQTQSPPAFIPVAAGPPSGRRPAPRPFWKTPWFVALTIVGAIGVLALAAAVILSRDGGSAKVIARESTAESEVRDYLRHRIDELGLKQPDFVDVGRPRKGLPVYAIRELGPDAIADSFRDKGLTPNKPVPVLRATMRWRWGDTFVWDVFLHPDTGEVFMYDIVPPSDRKSLPD